MAKQIPIGNRQLESAEKNRVEIFLLIGHTSDPNWKIRNPSIIPHLSNNFREHLYQIDTINPEKLAAKLGTDEEQIETIKSNLHFGQEAVFAFRYWNISIPLLTFIVILKETI